MDEKELKELRKQVKELRKTKAKVTMASVEELKREIMIHTAGEKALEAQKKRMEALEKARAVRASVVEKKPRSVVAEEKREVVKPRSVIAEEKRKVEKPRSVVAEEKRTKIAKEEKSEPVLSKNVRRRVVNGDDA